MLVLVDPGTANLALGPGSTGVPEGGEDTRESDKGGGGSLPALTVETRNS